MKNMIKIYLAVLFSFGLCVSQAYANSEDAQSEISQSKMIKAFEDFQSDADIVRLNHMKHWVTLIELYHTKTGKYPFQGESKYPIMVEIATPEQKADIKHTPPPPIKLVPMKEFVQTLEDGLGKTVIELYDPQYKAFIKPNFYIYMVQGNDYYFAIHTHTAYKFSRNLTDGYNKTEISNSYSSSTPWIHTSEFFQSADFIKNTNIPMHKANFFKQREDKTLHISKE